MIVSAINWLSISIDLLLVVFVIVCILMSMIILMQRPKNEGLGAAFGSGATDQLFGARTTNVLQKATVYLATLFFLLTLTLAILIQKRTANSPTLISKTTPAEAVAPKAEEKPASIAEEAAKDGEKPLEPEAVTPPAEAPAATPTPVEGTPAPAPEATETPKPDAAPAEGEKPAEQTPPPAEEKAPEN